MITGEGCATMSDPRTGELLFYTNGIQVWNRQHQVMPNGSGLLSDRSSSQAALIVPFPGQPRRYYLFAVNSVSRLDQTTLPGLTYSIVNMELDGGLGDIEPQSKNSRLLVNTSEKLTAVPHANGKDYWVITHGYNNNEFYVFLLTETGVSGPETFPIGMEYGVAEDALTYDAAGYLKASPNGRRLACTTWAVTGLEPVELFDFDPATGIISNQVSLGEIFTHYGVSFSPDNSKLYISGVYVTQFDLSLPTTQDIINSQIQITPTPPPYTGSLVQSLQLGPDGRLYNNKDFNKFYVINFPNRAGMACDPMLVEFELKNEGTGIGLPNFMQHYFNGLEPIDACSPESGITVFPNPTENSFKIQVNSDCYQIEAVNIFNSIGQQITSLQTDEVTGEIDIATLAAGMYVLHIITNTKDIIKKVVKI